MCAHVCICVYVWMPSMDWANALSADAIPQVASCFRLKVRCMQLAAISATVLSANKIEYLL